MTTERVSTLSLPLRIADQIMALLFLTKTTEDRKAPVWLRRLYILTLPVSFPLGIALLCAALFLAVLHSGARMIYNGWKT